MLRARTAVLGAVRTVSQSHVTKCDPTGEVGSPDPLVDSFGRRHDYLRISLTERCNLRCQYCMPEEGVPLSPKSALLTADEVVTVARLFRELGVRKVRLTGGEPTLRPDLPELVRRLKQEAGVPHVGLTSNGVALARRLPALVRAGLDALNLSLDSLRPDRYLTVTRRAALPRVLATLDTALQVNVPTVKLNTVLMRDFNEDEVCDFAELARDRPIDVRFIEFMPFGGNSWTENRLVPYREALRQLTGRYPDLKPLSVRPGDVARMWQVAQWRGRVGFIASMTAPFCGTCSRLRLTADGSLKACLLGGAELSIRDLLRRGLTRDQLAETVRTALAGKRAQHAGLETLATLPNRPMILIGG